MRETQEVDANYECNCLLLSNLRHDIKEGHILRFVRKVADPVSVAMSSFDSGRHTGKAYVAMESPALAHRVMAELNGNLIVGRPVVMKFVPADTMKMEEKEQIEKREEYHKADMRLPSSNVNGRMINLLGAAPPSDSSGDDDNDDAMQRKK